MTGTLGAQEIRLVRSLSGPSGKVQGSAFVFDEVRTRFLAGREGRDDHEHPRQLLITQSIPRCHPGCWQSRSAWMARPPGRILSKSPGPTLPERRRWLRHPRSIARSTRSSVPSRRPSPRP